MELANREWKEFSIMEVFKTVQRGKRLKKDDHIFGKTPYASSTAFNNGLDTFIGNTENIRVFGNCLTIANSGSVGSTFYQPFKVVASDHVTKLENKNFNKYIYLFLANSVSKLREKYAFNREINDKRIKKEKILLPINSKGEPDYAFMENYMRKKETELLKQYEKQVSDFETVVPLSEKEWKEFSIENVFEIKSGKRLIKSDMNSGNIPFVGATKLNNGITEFISNKNSSLDKNVLGVNYNGSVVYNFYHPYEAIFSDDVKRFSFRKIEGNKYLYLFVKVMIFQQKSKYEYGYKFNEERMNCQKILLPINSESEPDYTYMANYMKALESGKIKQYLEYKKQNTNTFA